MYDSNPIGSASFRYGVTPRIPPVEGHAEGGAGLANLGAGVDFGLWHYGVASLAFSGSEFGTAILAAKSTARLRPAFGAPG